VFGAGRDIFLKRGHLHELRQALHGKQEGGLRSPGGLQNLCEVLVPERREFVEHDTEQRTVDLPALFFAFVACADDELQVLQQHLAECTHRFRILVHIERDEENQPLLDDIIDREQIFVGPVMTDSSSSRNVMPH